jgi:NAD(P)H-flavin reductase
MVTDAPTIHNHLPRSLFAIRHFRAKLCRVVDLTPSTKHLEWEIVDGPGLDFRAGQFVSLEIQNGSHTELRPYSIASPPRGSLRFDLCLNRVKGGFASNYLCDLQPGATLCFKGPYGLFVVDQSIDRDLVFLATGTGVAPFRSMLLDLFARKPECDREVSLIFGVRYPEDILYKNEFESLQLEHIHFHFLPVVSRPSPEWTGAIGHVQDQLRTLFSGRKDFSAYLCGVNEMVDEVQIILRCEFALEPDQIRSETFA